MSGHQVLGPLDQVADAALLAATAAASAGTRTLPSSSCPTPPAPYLIQLYGGAAWRQPTHQTITHDVWQCLSGSEGHHDPHLTVITVIRTWWGASPSVADSCQVPASLATTGSSSPSWPTMNELMPKSARSCSNFSDSRSVDPMNRCGESSTSR